MLWRFWFFTLVFLIISCTPSRPPSGSSDNPIKIFFVPSVDVKVIEDSSKVIKKFLESTTPYKYQIIIPTNYITVVEAFGTKRADFAAINTFGYYLAHERYQAEAKLTVIRHGDSTYRAQFIVRSDSEISSIKELNNKKIAFVDPASISGYLLPMKVFKDQNIKPHETVFSMSHDNVVSMVLQKQVDAGATYYSPPINGEIQDARRLVKTQYPDIEKQIRILDLTEAIPNDPIIVRKDLPDEIKTSVIAALLNFMNSPEGKTAFDKILAATAFKEVKDKDYDQVRIMLKTLSTMSKDTGK